MHSFCHASLLIDDLFSPFTLKVIINRYVHACSVVSVMSDKNLCNPLDCSARLLCLWDSPGKNNGGVTMPYSRGIFLTQRLIPAFQHYRWVLYCWAPEEAPPIGMYLLPFCILSSGSFCSSLLFLYSSFDLFPCDLINTFIAMLGFLSFACGVCVSI